MLTWRHIPILSFALLTALPSVATAQQLVAMPMGYNTGYDTNGYPTGYPAAQQQAAAPVNPQIDQLLAPIALYPDPLLSQILMASTYPLEVIEADRWRQDPNNARLSSYELDNALAQQTWDPSVKALAAFPQVLSEMDQNIQWTQQLGQAFMTQQADVMDSVQRLRQMAQASGSLTSTPQQNVVADNGAIGIQPASTQEIYVPSYNPESVYAAWPYPNYPPYYFSPYYGYSYGTFGALTFASGVFVTDYIWGWNRFDWHRHHIDIDDHRFANLNNGRAPLSPGIWHFDPAHRHDAAWRGGAPGYTHAAFNTGGGGFQNSAAGGTTGVRLQSPTAQPLINTATGRAYAPGGIPTTVTQARIAGRGPYGQTVQYHDALATPVTPVPQQAVNFPHPVSPRPAFIPAVAPAQPHFNAAPANAAPAFNHAPPQHFNPQHFNAPHHNAPSAHPAGRAAPAQGGHPGGGYGGHAALTFNVASNAVLDAAALS